MLSTHMLVYLKVITCLIGKCCVKSILSLIHVIHVFVSLLAFHLNFVEYADGNIG